MFRKQKSESPETLETRWNPKKNGHSSDSVGLDHTLNGIYNNNIDGSCRTWLDVIGLGSMFHSHPFDAQPAISASRQESR
jgi:hypothetical protein